MYHFTTIQIPTFYCSVESAEAADDNGCKSPNHLHSFEKKHVYVNTMLI